MTNLLIRPLRAAEIPLLRDLAEDTFREAFAHALPGPALEQLLTGRFTLGKFEALQDDPEGNPRGRAFYHRWGFGEVGREDMDVCGTLLAHLILVKTW